MNHVRLQCVAISLAVGLFLSLATSILQATDAKAPFQLATFSADVTPPVGHPLLANLVPPATAVNDPLFAKGIVLLGPDGPIVLVAVDWCEIRNEAHDRWREVLAEAAGTTPNRVLVASVHQHDAPLADLEAERILRSHKLTSHIIDLDFHEKAVRNVARALRDSLASAVPITHIGLGKAKARQLASNRRYLDDNGRPRYDRMSTTHDATIRARPEGTIDPWLKTLVFYHGDQPVAALSAYATHPMSYYGTGRISADFPGLARRRRQLEMPEVAQIYFSGASGNLTVGKYNDGSPANRQVLADRLYQAMKEAWQAIQRYPLQQVEFRAVPLRLEPRGGPDFTVAGLEKKLTTSTTSKAQCLAAMGLAWRKRADAGYRLDLPVIDFGVAQFVLLPAESYIEFQLLAQKLRPDSFVMVAGYGECAPGYIPIERAWQEQDFNLDSWCWVAPGAEQAMGDALRAALQVPKK